MGVGNHQNVFENSANLNKLQKNLRYFQNISEITVNFENFQFQKILVNFNKLQEILEVFGRISELYMSLLSCKKDLDSF